MGARSPDPYPREVILSIAHAATTSIQRLVRHLEANTLSGHPGREVIAALFVAPLVEEAAFRAGAFRLSGRRRGEGGRGAVGLGSAVVFALMHVRFGYRFVAYAFVGGLLLWAAYERTGYWGAVALHASANLVDLSLGVRRRLSGRGRDSGHRK
jgi:membrane protease YdiL (CAAX protease family)